MGQGAETCQIISVYSLPSLTLLILFRCVTYQGFSTSLDRFTSALQVNSKARRGFQAFAVTQMKVMMDDYRKMFL